MLKIKIPSINLFARRDEPQADDESREILMVLNPETGEYEETINVLNTETGVDFTDDTARGFGSGDSA
jgi:hypothetical protein